MYNDYGVAYNKEIRKEAHMATSSFTKTFVFNAEARLKLDNYVKKPTFTVPSTKPERVEEGKQALARFSFPSKK